MNKKVSIDYWPNVWNRFQSGDKEAFGILYNHHVDNLYQYGTKLCKDDEEVKDSIQELFLELYFRRNKISISCEHLKYWLLLALKRKLIKKLQAERKFGQIEIIDFEPEYSIEFQIIEREKNAEIHHRIKNALSQLPAKQKEAVFLRFNESLEYHEIAVLLEIDIESVRKQIYRALKRIREEMR